ncbi:MAG: hypothetical protein ACYC27_06550 [Armatimonadota bacterium]
MSVDISERIPPPEPKMRRVIVWLAVYAFTGVALVSAIMFGTHQAQHKQAVIGMMLVVVLVWIVIGGTLGLLYKDRVRAFVMKLPGSWQLKFVVFATIMALLEEVCTVTMTNCAPLFGVKIGEAYITASTNYFDVVLGHSVIVFIPQFIFWAWLLSRYHFSPAVVFLLYGIAGNIGEVMFGGLSNAAAGFWIFIYGLMVYLPAYCIPVDRDVKKPKWWLYPLTVILPGFASAPVVALVNYLHPTQPTHFPPIKM